MTDDMVQYVVISVTWYICIILGMKWGIEDMRDEAVARGLAEWDSKTREFKWKKGIIK